MQITKAETRPQENSWLKYNLSFFRMLTYRDVQVHRVRPEVDHDALHGHGRQGDAPREEEEEDEAADEETHGHGDEHVQLPGKILKKQKLFTLNRIVLLNRTDRTFLFRGAHVRLGSSLTSLHGITATSRSLSPDDTKQTFFKYCGFDHKSDVKVKRGELSCDEKKKQTKKPRGHTKRFG